MLNEEVLLSTSLEDSATNIIDFRNGNIISTFKQNKCERNCLSLVSLTGQPNRIGLILSAQNDKALIHVYSLFKEQIHNKLFCPEKLVSLSVSNKGTYCAGGTDNGKIYIWELSTGTLCKVFDAHYKKINVMRFTNDDIALITGSDDSSVNVWLFGSILDTDDDDNNNNDLLIPYYSWSDHSLPITDIICGVGNFNTCRILTSSMDNTCKIWDLSTGYLLTTFIFPSIINCIEFDKIERMFFCGCNNKLIYQVNLYKNIGNSSNGGGIIRSVGGNKKIEDIDTSKSLIFSGHNSQITSIEMPLFNDNILISGSEDGEIIVWDIFIIDQEEFANTILCDIRKKR
ncbi:2375_t:CDS:2 [Entrophospora sp. SA101]|nr:2375_t:CDS:2 [Entrophospora sp. SA101]